ncbi:MAG: flagellar hook-basal body complex protein FliE [Planctomycetes bacterium]|nr:flagellar hook-basal body complex protein FliE [Planctomycetota bacterium]
MTATNVGLNGLGGVGGVKSGANGNVQTADGAEFRDFLLNNLEKVNQMQSEANTAVEDLVTGNETDITKVMSAVEKADVAFQTLMAVRGKLVDSYKEIMQIRL